MSEATQSSKNEAPKTDSTSTDTKGDDSNKGGSVEAKTTETKSEAVAEEYELELADDSPLSDDELNEIASEASRLGLSKEDAQKLIGLKEAAYKNSQSKYETDRKAKIEADLKKITSDPDFVGEKKAETFQSISRAVETFGDSELVELLKTPEFGNNLVIARFLKRLGDAMKPEGFHGKGTMTAADDKGDSSLKSMYPEFFKDK